MDEISIPHAKALVDKTGTPYEKLLVWTKLPEHSSTNDEARATQDMLNAIAVEVSDRGLHGGCEIAWSFNANQS